MQIKKQFIMAFLAVFVVILTLGSASAFDKVVVFGDSLSDDGNLFQADASQFPDSGYYWEGRFSNGPVWIEYLTAPDMLNVPLENRAIGGAETGGLESANLLAQIYFHIETSASPSQDTLFAIWIGGNDFISGDKNAVSAVENVHTALKILVDFGATRFLLLNLPDLGHLPRYSGTLEAPSATDFSIEFNTGLAQMVGRFQQDNLQILIDQCDIHSMFSEILANPNQYGFNNVTEASPNFTVENNFDNSAGYLFWDNTHPTTETHALVAERAFLLVNASNETPINNPDETPRDESDNDDSCFISVLW